MNFKDIINYRNNCILCNRRMVIRLQNMHRTRIRLTGEGLVVKASKDMGIIFKHDWTYHKNKKWSDLLTKSLHFIKECPHCRQGKRAEFNMSHASWGKGALSLESMTSLQNYYTFEISGDGQGNFKSTIDIECIKYANKSGFWHVLTSYKTNVTKLTHAVFCDEVRPVFYLNLPTWNTSNINSLDRFLDKYKSYIIFS